MTKFGHRDLPAGLPSQVEDVHRELLQVQIEERSSFAVELEAELEREWARLSAPGARPRRFPLRYAAAAAAAVLVLGTLAVPPARASLVRLIWPQPQPEVAVEEAVEELPVVAEAPPPPVEEPTPYSKPAPPRVDEVELADIPEWPAPLPTTFPVLLDRERARSIVQDEYPDSLQVAGIGGRVQVLLWVRPDGGVDYTQIGKTSGLPGLDMAALRATRALRFLPATRAGEAVGTWVEFSIEFRPFADEAQPAQADHGIQIPLSN